MRHARVGLVLAALALVTGCGDDESSTNKEPAGGAGKGGDKSGGSGGIMLRDPTPSTPDGGTTSGNGNAPTGSQKEGDVCNARLSCAAELSCVESGIMQLKICARPCTEADAATECESAEECFLPTATSTTGYCVNLTPDDFQECGPQKTQFCQPPYICALLRNDEPMTPENETLGLCVQQCTPETDADAGLVMAECAAGQSCLPGDEICATVVGAGAECGGESGTVCDVDAGLTCFPDDIADPDSKWSCHQSCEEAGTVCKTGQCKAYSREDGSMLSVCN